MSSPDPAGEELRDDNDIDVVLHFLPAVLRMAWTNAFRQATFFTVLSCVLVSVPVSTSDAIQKELLRMEEDCTHSGKAHFNASERWNFWNYVFGIPSIVLSAAAGTAFFKDYSVAAGIMTSGVTVLTSLMTFLKPSEKSAAHKSSGDQYLALRNDSRVFREIGLSRDIEEGEAVKAMEGFTTRRNELNQASPAFSDADFRKAKAGIDAGEALHVVDKA